MCSRNQTKKKERHFHLVWVITIALVLSISLSSCSATLEHKEEAKRTEEGIALGNQVGVLIGTLEYNEAIKLLEENESLVQNDDKLLNTYASIKSLIFNENQEAEEYINKAIEINPNEANHYMALGYIKQAQKEYEAAIKNYEKAIKNINTVEGLWNTEAATVYKYIGDSYLELNDIQSALDAYEKGRKSNPYNIELNAKLHRLYVQNEEYTKAYSIWATDNFVIQGEENLYPQIDKWNVLYQEVLRNNMVSHLELANLYNNLALYDEAKIEYERALNENSQNEELKTRLNEINIYIAFREDFKHTLENYYRDRSINGVKAHLNFYQNLEPVYQKITVLFPELKEKKSSIKAWVEDLDKAIEKKFKVRIENIKANGTMLGSHFGRIIDRSSIHSVQWGQEIDLQVIVLKNMVSNGLDYWRMMGRGGVGGWSISTDEVVKVTQDSENDAMIETLSLYNENFRRDNIETARQYDNTIADKKPLDLYFSYELSNQLMIKQMDIELEKAKQKGITDEELKNYIFHRLKKELLINSSIYIHESQHSLDSKNGLKVNWFGEYEYRAKMSQLAYGEMRFAVLNNFYNPTIGTDEKNTHTRANTKVFKDIVQYIYDHHEQYPQIDIQQNILKQLPSLTEEELKQIVIQIVESTYPGMKF